MKVETMNPVTRPLSNLRRCGAKTRRGTACLCPAMKNGRALAQSELRPVARQAAVRRIEREDRRQRRRTWLKLKTDYAAAEPARSAA